MINNKYALLAKNVSRKFGKKTVVDKVNLTVQEGHIHGFLGPNGCGKSTTIRMLTGLLTPTEGDITVLGLNVPKQSEKLREKIGYMTQKFSLYGELTVYENLRFLTRLYGMPRKSGLNRVNEQINTYDLSDLKSQRSSTLSGGQKQRLSLAAATLHYPKLLFLDEPTSSVDPENRREFWRKLFDLSNEGISILITTHYMDEAERCHELAIMDAGHIRAQGPPKQLMRDMNIEVLEVRADNLHQFKTEFLSHKDVLSVTQTGAILRVLVHKGHWDSPALWLKNNFSSLQQAQVDTSNTNLEDAFVFYTKKQDAQWASC